ncbi:hypothetical protein WJX73_010181 [Symbiochloris irregularis]|uniref:AB hydrolase-1 domain-containing protein n=1 Tax=Symbiochloris irregularis TaxID=706552 RepID=A0AAW1P6S5_9CHLO
MSNDITKWLGPVRYRQIGDLRWGFYKIGPEAQYWPPQAGIAEEEPALMLITGLGLTVQTWGPKLLRGLAEKRTVYALDNPGMGYSKDEGSTATTVAAVVNAYADFITSEGLKQKPHILGWSYGGAVALALGIEHGHLLGKLVIAAGDYGGSGNDPRSTASQAADGDIENAASLFFPDTPEGRAGARSFIEGHNALPDDPLTPDTVQLQLESMYQFHKKGQGIQESLPSIANPVLILQGQEDTFVPPVMAETMEAAIPNVRLVLSPGAGHGVLFQEPSRLTEIENFLSS